MASPFHHHLIHVCLDHWTGFDIFDFDPPSSQVSAYYFSLTKQVRKEIPRAKMEVRIGDGEKGLSRRYQTTVEVKINETYSQTARNLIITHCNESHLSIRT